MQSISQILTQFKQNWTQELSPAGIAQAALDAGMSWNESLLTPITTIQIFFLQILHGNTACTHLPHLAGLEFTAAAYCRARKRIKLEVLVTLLARCVGKLQDDAFETVEWLGHRVFHMDGSSFSMPDTPELQAHFGQPGSQKQGCGFPVAHWLVQTHARTGMIVNMLAAPLRTHEMSGAAKLHPELRKGDLLVGDRGFCSYAHLGLLCQREVAGLMRMHQRVIVDFTPRRAHVVPGTGTRKTNKGKPRSRWIKKLGKFDQVVEWFKPTTCPSWMNAEQYALLPDFIRVREVQYKIPQKGFRADTITLATTLLDAKKYSVSDLAEQFRQRWEIETNFGHLKTTMNMDVLKCKTVEGVLRELHVFALVYNMIRQVLLEAACRQKVDVRRISFIDALRWLLSAQVGDDLCKLVVNPYRPNRLEPRVKKRRPKQFDLMTKPRHQLKQELTGK